MCEWLETRKDHLKELLIKKFEKNYDYNETKITKTSNKTKSNNYIEILITPQCFKELCMISQTKKAKEVRKYFLEMEKLIKRYYTLIKESIEKEIGILKDNQKPKVNINEGVIYVIEAQNTISGSQKLFNVIEKTPNILYKIGKTSKTKPRMSTYNTGNANDIHPLFIIKVKDVDEVEHCIQRALRGTQYRKYKEVYEVDLEIIKKLAEKCDDFIEGFKKIFIEHKKDIKKNIARFKKTENRVFMILKHV